MRYKTPGLVINELYVKITVSARISSAPVWGPFNTQIITAVCKAAQMFSVKAYKVLWALPEVKVYAFINNEDV